MRSTGRVQVSKGEGLSRGAEVPKGSKVEIAAQKMGEEIYCIDMHPLTVVGIIVNVFPLSQTMMKGNSPLLLMSADTYI